MSVKSLFVPSYALQGQKVPIHVTWENMAYKEIRVEFPLNLELENCYNVKEILEEKKGLIAVRKVEVEGYLAVLFSTKILPENFSQNIIKISFINEREEIIFETEKTLSLFRPNLVVEETPQKIFIDLDRKFVSPRIKLKNSGAGTVWITILTNEESEIQKETPHNFKDYIEKVYSTLKEKFSALEKQYPNFSGVLKNYLWFFENYGMEYKDRRGFLEYKQHVQEITEALNKNEDFYEKFVNALAEAILVNIYILTITESFLLFLNSIAANRVLTNHPEDIIKVGKKKTLISLTLMPTDLLLNEYPPIKIGPIEISASDEGDIELLRLFKWIEQNDRESK